MDERLAHLTETQIEELIERYYNKGKVKDLSKNLKLMCLILKNS